MPWTSADAWRHTKLATTEARRDLWASTANRILETTGDEGKAVRIANSAVAKRVRDGIDRRAAKSRHHQYRLI